MINIFYKIISVPVRMAVGCTPEEGALEKVSTGVEIWQFVFWGLLKMRAISGGLKK